MGLLFVTVASGFEKDALAELRTALGDAVVYCRSLFKGVVIVTTSIGGRSAAKIVWRSKTKLVARVVPVDRVVRAGVKSIVGAVLKMDRISAADAFAVRCRRRGTHPFSSRDVERAVGSAIEIGRVDLENPTKIVNIEILFSRAYVSILRVGEIVTKRIRVERKWQKGKRPINRSELKILEALGFYPQIASCKVALDLGSAPGGWTKVLSSNVERVYSVDPAPLDQTVSGLKNVVYLSKRLEELTTQDVPQRTDLITCDANISAQELVSVIEFLVVNFLAEEGFLVLTLKAVTSSLKEELKESVEALKEKLQPLGVSVLSVTKLPHNTRKELTCICRRG